ncbi:hypothetical protein OG467_09110 [Streptomyces sp. NBC_01361]|nr:hypothetical protein [Streptomyces sp. NBC_01361]
MGLKYGIRPLICGFVVVSTGGLVLVDGSAEGRCAVDEVLDEVDGARRSGFSLRWTELVQCAVRPVPVVVLQVPGEGSAQVPFVEDECPVEELAAQGADEPFAVCVRFRGLGRAFEDAQADVGEDGVEGVGVLAVAVTDQELGASDVDAGVDEEVAGGVGGPWAGGVGARQRAP